VLYHKYPDESELLIYFIEGLMSENQTDEALEYLSYVEPSPEKLITSTFQVMVQHNLNILTLRQFDFQTLNLQ
jgi:hypothetical protein